MMPSKPYRVPLMVNTCKAFQDLDNIHMFWHAYLLMIGEPGTLSSASSNSHQPSVSPKVRVRKSVFADNSLATSRPPLRSSALHCCRVRLKLRVACSTLVANTISY